MNRRDRRVAARKSATPLKGGADTPAGLQIAALTHFQAGRHRDAQHCCRQALALDPKHAETLHLMGLLYLQAKQYDAAIDWIDQANRADPKTNYLSGLGVALEQQGLHAEAVKAFEKAVQITPDDAELWTRLASVLSHTKRPDQALLSYEHALKLDPRSWYAAYNRANLLFQLERFEEALVDFNLCVELQLYRAMTLTGRGATLLNLNRLEESLADNREAHALDPANGDVCHNIGDALQKLGRHEEALEWFDRALHLIPGSVRTLLGKAFSMSEIQRHQEAIAISADIKRIDPEKADADWNVSLINLLNGDLEAGFQGREARWKIPSLPGTIAYPKFTQPMWDGEENIAGKTILVCADEGLGDTIQFVRYAPMLANLGARVILLPQESLHTLLSGVPGVAQCLPNMDEGLPPYDLHCPVMSLPRAFRTTLETIPAPISYLPNPTKMSRQVWEERLDRHDRLRVGLVWSGNSKHKNDHNRSIPFHSFSSILDTDALFVSLQKDPRPNDRAMLRERPDILDAPAYLTDFSETAALISCLDLVITVDTSVAHLAGAMGCPTWILLPYTPDWRWLLDREDSPWYPTVRLFRQSKTRDYGEVLDRVQSELLTLIADR